MEAFLLTKSRHLKKKKSQLENCSLDCEVSGNHQMRQSYHICECSKELKCPITLKINVCQKANYIVVYEEKDSEMLCINQDQEETTKKSTRGISTFVKNLIEEMCLADPDETPKKILSILIKKNHFPKALTPSLSQVCIIN